jgi:hypothetical protein
MQLDRQADCGMASEVRGGAASEAKTAYFLDYEFSGDILISIADDLLAWPFKRR